MNPTSASELVEKLKRMVSESHSIAAQLEEYQRIIKTKDEEIEFLQTMLDESHASNSTLENRLEELENLKEKLIELDTGTVTDVEDPHHVRPQSYREVPAPDRSNELDELRQKNIELQARLDDMPNHMLLLKREAMTALRYKQRIGELESRLAALEPLEPEKENKETSAS
jgi:DNA repair exonuclease SbcCD ATPase subunit